MRVAVVCCCVGFPFLGLVLVLLTCLLCFVLVFGVGFGVRFGGCCYVGWWVCAF